MEKTYEQNTYILQEDENLGTVKIADDVVAMIAGLAATEVEGVAAMAEISVMISLAGWVLKIWQRV